MSRSYRKPYASVCGNRSAHQDKTLAARGFRRKEKATLRSAVDWEDYIHPVQLEAANNDPWGWSRDGKQKLQYPPSEHYYFQLSWWARYRSQERIQYWYDRAVQYYERLKRK